MILFWELILMNKFTTNIKNNYGVATPKKSKAGFVSNYAVKSSMIAGNGIKTKEIKQFSSRLIINK